MIASFYICRSSLMQTIWFSPKFKPGSKIIVSGSVICLSRQLQTCRPQYVTLENEDKCLAFSNCCCNWELTIQWLTSTFKTYVNATRPSCCEFNCCQLQHLMSASGATLSACHVCVSSNGKLGLPRRIFSRSIAVHSCPFLSYRFIYREQQTL